MRFMTCSLWRSSLEPYKSEKALEDRKKEVIKDLLRQKEAAIKAFDDKLEKLGYDPDHAGKRSHHAKHDDKKPE